MKDKILNQIRSKRTLAILAVAVIAAMAITSFPVHIHQGSPDDGAFYMISTGVGPYYITIGSPVSATDADYTCDGSNDNVEFQAALDALPYSGGQLFVLAGNYSFADLTTVERAIDNVSIIGVSASVSFTGDGTTAIFTAGGNGWFISNIETDAGGLDMGSTTDYMWLHVNEGGTYYHLKTDSIDIEDHSSLHGVGGADTIFPADPGADRFLMWDDDPGQLSWEQAGTGSGDMLKSTYDTDEDGLIDTAAGGTEWDSSAANGVVYITAGAYGTRATGITNTYIVVIDDADAISTDYARFTGSGLQGRDSAEVKSDLGLVIGTDVQAYDDELAALAGLTSAADKAIYFTGSGTADTTDLTSFARSILDDSNEATFKATVNLEIGTDVQAWDADLDEIAALVDDDSNFIVGNGGSWIVESAATARASLGLIIGTDVQAWDAELAALAGLTSAADKVPYFTGSGSADVADFSAYGRSLVAVADEGAFKLLTNLEIGVDVLAQQTIGIADDNLVEIDDADAAASDYARFTANGLEGRDYDEVRTDLSVPDITSASVTLYVDAGSGDDGNPGTSGSPKQTINGALDDLPAIIAHTCTIKVRGQQNYADYLSFDRFSTLDEIRFEAVNANDEAMFDNGQADAGAGNNELDDATKSWSTDQFNGAYVWIYEGTGAGQVREISDTTATKLTVTVNWATNPDATSYYAIGGGASLTSIGTVHVSINGKNVKFYGFRHTGATSYNILANNYAFVYDYYAYHETGSNGFFMNAGSTGYTYYSWYNVTGKGTAAQTATLYARACVFYGMAYGSYSSYVGLVLFNNAAGLGNYFDSCSSYGAYATTGSGCTFATVMTYTGCGADYGTDAGTTSWYS